MDKTEQTILIGIVVGVICICVGVNYFVTYSNFQSIPYYDKFCGLNMTQTWENAGKLWYIDLENCNYNNVVLQK